MLFNACAIPSINTNPFYNNAEYYWNNQVLLVSPEFEEIYYYGFRVSFGDWIITPCAGYQNTWCIDKDLLKVLNKTRQ